MPDALLYDNIPDEVFASIAMVDYAVAGITQGGYAFRRCRVRQKGSANALESHWRDVDG
jgi:hypothetical protein